MDADNLDPRLRGPDPASAAHSKDSTNAAGGAEQQQQSSSHPQPNSSSNILSSEAASQDQPQQQQQQQQDGELATSTSTAAEAAAPSSSSIPTTSGALPNETNTESQDGFQQAQQSQQHHLHLPTSTIAPAATLPAATTSSSLPLQHIAPNNNPGSYYPTTPGSAATLNNASPWNRPPTTLSQQHSPATPQSAPLTPGQPLGAAVHAGGIPHGVGEHGGTPGSADPKRSRACEACRGLKVRCEPADPANPDAPGPCKRCAKAGRQCLVTAPTRKRQKKADSRVAELEKKIDALTASLNANRTGPGLTPPPASAPTSAIAPVATTATTHHNSHPAMVAAPIPDVVMGGTDTRHVATPAAPPIPSSSSTSWAAAAVQPPRPVSVQDSASPRDAPFNSSSMVAAGLERKLGLKRKLAEALLDVHEGGSMPTTTPPVPRPGQIEHTFSDIVDREIISMEQASELWNRYVTHMVPHLPAVVFPPETTVADIRKNKPSLFLAIMASASAEMPAIQKVLIRELMQMFAHKIVVVGEKYLELVQALHIAVIWYYPPDHFEELKFYQLVHMAAVMAIDIGLGRKRPSLGKRGPAPYTWRDHPYRKHPFPDSCSIEGRRTWLTCYFLASNTSMALHRPNLIRWTKFLSESFDILRTSPEAAPTDEYLCHLVWTHKLAEEVGVQFELDDPSQLVNIADKRTQHALRGFEYDLEKYSGSIPPELQQPSLRLSFHLLSLYMHEVALHGDKEEFIRPPIVKTSEGCLAEPFADKTLTSHHINALSACLTAIDGIFDTFLSMEIQNIRCLPVFNYVRVAYAVVVLIKLFFAASAPNSELGRVIDKDNMKVEQHLNDLLEKFKATAAEDRSRPAAKFLLVLMMLKAWFVNRGKGPIHPPSCPSAEGMQVPFPSQSSDGNRAQQQEGQVQQAQQQQQPRPQQDFSATANTPLQLLSEVATNDPSRSQPQTTASSSAPAQAPVFGTGSSNWGQTQPMFLDGNAASTDQFSGAGASGPGVGGTGDYSSGTSASGAGPSNVVGASSAASLLAGQPQQQYAMPWFNPAFDVPMDYSNFMTDDGLERAMTLAGFGDAMSLGLGNGLSMADGMGVGLNLDLSQMGIPDGAAGGGFY